MQNGETENNEQKARNTVWKFADDDDLRILWSSVVSYRVVWYVVTFRKDTASSRGVTTFLNWLFNYAVSIEAI
jgi:hypothetical protein